MQSKLMGRYRIFLTPFYLTFVNYPPKVAVSALVNSLKGVSSCMIRKKNYQNIRKKLWGGAPIEILRQYIEHKKTPH
jgi:putative transposase